MKIKDCCIYAFLFLICLNLKGQDVGKLVDSAYLEKVNVKFKDFVESIDSLRERKDDLSVYYVYYTYLKDKDIEESKISPEYYLSGEFLEDLQDLKILQKNTYNIWQGKYFEIGDILVYDKNKDIVYRYYPNSNLLERYYYDNELLYRYIAKLYKNGQIDCAFFYPSIINKPAVWQEHYSQLMYLVFAIKNGEYYVIRDGKDKINAPAMYSLKDFVNCCWNEMIGIEE